MRLLRGLAGLLCWVGALLLGLVGVIACVTVILIPLGVPLLGYARRLFTTSMKLMLPRVVTHPVETVGKSARKQGDKTSADVQRLGKRGRKSARRARKQLRVS